MGNDSQFYQILVILVIVHEAMATIISTKFKKSDAGKTMTGKIGAELTTRSKLQCSDRCSSGIGCKVYRYKEKGQVNCLLIHDNSTAAEGHIFEGDDNSTLFEKDKVSTSSSTCERQKSTEVTSNTWKPPDGWSGPCPALYRSLDTSGSLVLMEVDQNMYPIPLVTGKIHSALTLDATRQQWVDLGIHTEACLTQPETCSSAGGAISLWLKVIDCPSICGIISSQKVNDWSGLAISYTGGNINIGVFVQDAWFQVLHPFQQEWTHIVLNTYDNEVRLYLDGQEVKDTTTKTPGTYLPGDGRIVVGRAYTNLNQFYISMLVDEVIYFNKALSRDEISDLFLSL